MRRMKGLQFYSNGVVWFADYNGSTIAETDDSGTQRPPRWFMKTAERYVRETRPYFEKKYKKVI